MELPYEAKDLEFVDEAQPEAKVLTTELEWNPWVSPRLSRPKDDEAGMRED